MSDEIRVNRVASPAAQMPPVAGPPTVQTAVPHPASKMPWVILGVVVVVLVVLGFLFRDKLFARPADSGKAAPAKLSGYQAVFLTNGQVYFGKISGQDDNTVTLKDIYYLQVIQPPLQGQQQTGQQQTAQQQAAAAAAQPQISLVKLGSELHGPVDEMHIYKSQILFYEDMKDDGKVAQAIKQYQANPNPAPAAAGQQPAPAAGQAAPAPTPAPTPAP